MSSPSALLIASPAPRLHVAPVADKTYGDIAGRFAADYGLTPDDWQQTVLDDWLAETGGKWASLTCGLSAPRQNGKNGIIEMRELFGMVGRGERILHTAHEVKTARKAFKRLQHFFGKHVGDRSAKFPELNALVVELRNVNGQEAIFLSNGGSVEIAARSSGSARGWTVDVLVADEAQDLSDDDLEALLPTTSSAPLGNPQWIYTGTPPGPRSNGVVFSRIRDEALSGGKSRIAWHEWSSEEGADLDDHEAWRAANPALGSRLQFDVVAGERASGLSDVGFARERLGMWTAKVTPVAIDPDQWASLSDPDAERGSAVAFGVDLDEQRQVSVAVAWERPDGAVQVMLTDADLSASAAPRRLAELTERWGGLVVLGGPSSALEADLNLAVPVACMSGVEFAQTCGSLSDRVREGRVRHGNQTALNSAVRGARWRSVGTSGERAWQLKNAAGIGPLAAATRAVHGLGVSGPSVYEDRGLVEL